MNPNQATFNINVTAASGENYAGTFKIFKRLSHRNALRRDERRRELLGDRPEVAPDTMQSNAYIFSTCEAYIVDGPRWWTESGSGLDLLDQDPVAAIFNEISKVISEVESELEAKAKKSAEVLKTETK